MSVVVGNNGAMIQVSLVLVAASLVLVAYDDNREISTTWPSVCMHEEYAELIFAFLVPAAFVKIRSIESCINSYLLKQHASNSQLGPLDILCGETHSSVKVKCRFVPQQTSCFIYLN